jgi:FlaA1/EpsC-like NDP-sugar epimerase
MFNYRSPLNTRESKLKLSNGNDKLQNRVLFFSRRRIEEELGMKTILITGTSAGIGRATALHFLSKGWNVIATMRSPEKETELTKVENVLVTHLDVAGRYELDQQVNLGIKMKLRYSFSKAKAVEKTRQPFVFLY